MGVKVTISLKTLNGLLKETKKQFKKAAPKKIKEAIIGDIEKGVSPVRKQRFSKYSQSYKDTIRGKVTFRKNKQGNTYANKKPDKEFLKHGKGISPVNLKLSGAMLRSFFIKAPFIGIGAKLLQIGFKHFLADIHNRQGASVKKVIRRLLPRTNEKFNTKIAKLIRDELRIAVRLAIKKLSRL